MAISPRIDVVDAPSTNCGVAVTSESELSGACATGNVDVTTAGLEPLVVAFETPDAVNGDDDGGDDPGGAEGRGGAVDAGGREVVVVGGGAWRTVRVPRMFSIEQSYANVPTTVTRNGAEQSPG